MLMPLPEAIIAVWAPFAALFTQPVWPWYRKSEATFSDVLAMFSQVLWAEKYFMNSMDQLASTA